MTSRLLAIVPGLLAAALLACAIVGCAPSDSTAADEAADDRPTVAVSVPPHGWLVRRIGGDDVRILVALSGIASCHDGAPPEAAVVALSRADLYLRSGILAERGAWLDTVIRDGRVPSLDLLAAARDGLDPELAAAVAHDPHAWTSPRALRRQAAAIRDAFVERWPERAEAFRARATALDAELAALEAEVDARLAAAAGGTVVVDHAAWTWLAAEHGIDQLTVKPDPGSPSDRGLEDLRRTMTDRGIRWIVVQPQHDPRASVALAEAVGAELVSLDPMAADPTAAIAEAAVTLDRIAAGRSLAAGEPAPGT